MEKVTRSPTGTPVSRDGITRSPTGTLVVAEIEMVSTVES
jgi:hypothetical protein